MVLLVIEKEELRFIIIPSGTSLNSLVNMLSYIYLFIKRFSVLRSASRSWILGLIGLGFTGLCSPDGSLVCYLVGTYLLPGVSHSIFIQRDL